MPNIILSDTSASVSELKKIQWRQSVPEMDFLLQFSTVISPLFTALRQRYTKKCSMPWMTWS